MSVGFLVCTHHSSLLTHHYSPLTTSYIECMAPEISDKGLENLTRDIGREIFARLNGSASWLFTPAWWDDRLMEWTMADPAVKIQLFRFIDALPLLRTAPNSWHWATLPTVAILPSSNSASRMARASPIPTSLCSISPTIAGSPARHCTPCWKMTAPQLVRRGPRPMRGPIRFSPGSMSPNRRCCSPQILQVR